MDYNFQPRGLKEEFGWYKGKSLRHFDAEERAQFVTTRLADSMPQDLLKKWRKDAKSDSDFRKRIERFLDNGYGECWLRREAVAAMVETALKFHHAKFYLLIAWVIMPNHVHFLLQPLRGKHLDTILHSFKSYTAHEANKILGRAGQFWQHESFDRYIRDHRHFKAVIRYIENNPVKAGLCSVPEEWRFSSAWVETKATF
jgi:putative DNA methylase